MHAKLFRNRTGELLEEVGVGGQGDTEGVGRD